MSNADDIHLLILGSPRSGTTLLSAMLACHPEIALLNEDLNAASLSLFSKRIKGVKLCVPNQIEYEHSRWMRVVDYLVTIFQGKTNPLKSELGLRTPIPRGCKSKFSIRDYQQNTENLHIVGIIRNPQDAISSVMKRGQQSKRTAEYRWRRLIEVLYILSQDKNTTIFIIDFDRLVLDPVQTMKKVLGRMNCEFREEVLEGFKHTPQYKGNEGISASKASKGFSEAITHPMLSQDAVLKQKYMHLTGMFL